MTDVDVLAGEFAAHRAYLLGVGYRLTSSMSDAEDAVSEAWLRLAAMDPAQRAGIRDLRAWLTTVTSRLCLDRLRSAAARRESYVGPWLPEPVVAPLSGATADDPADIVARDEELRMAALLVLEELSPEQRVAFVLHDGLGYPFADIAETLGCSVAAARQHASRGRRTVADADPPPRADLAAQQEILQRFVTALASGDLPAVLAVLHPDAVMIGDSDGRARTARQVVRGQDKIARFILGLLDRHGDAPLTAWHPVLVNGDFGMLLPELAGADERSTVASRVVGFTVRDGLLAELYDIVNPAKLTHLPTDLTTDVTGEAAPGTPRQR